MSVLARLIEALTKEDRPAEQAAPIGVVFVHGIGSQGQSATVREFAQPLLDYLHEWHRTRMVPEWQPDSADLSYGDTLTGPARVSLKWPSYTRDGRTWPERRFIFAEAWWAARLDPPPLNTMIGWSLRTLRDVVAQLGRQIWHRMKFLAGGGGSSASDPGPLAALVEIASGAFFIVAYLAAAITGYVLLLPLFVIAQIPIKQVQEFILVTVLKPFLVENLGDHETYMYDEVQALNMRTALGDTVRDLLTRGCDQICVVAHSQGALVAFDGVCALGRDDPKTAAHVRKLITLGGALNRAFSQDRCPPRLRATLPAHIFWLDIWSYYDPVTGGYLKRTHAYPPMVLPSPAFRTKMGWDVPPGKKRYDGPLADQVTNSLNPLIDHGGYFQNPEQFANRVLAEIDDPSAYYKRSRFYLPHDRPQRVRRRRTRISVLAAWRLMAIGSFASALVLRGIPRVSADGRALMQLAPTDSVITELLTSPGAFFDGIGSVLDRIAVEIAALVNGVVGEFIAWVRSWWNQVAWSDFLLGSLAYAAAFAAIYWLLLWALYQGWDARERREAVAERLPPARARGLLIAVRTLAVLVIFVEAAIAVSAP